MQYDQRRTEIYRVRLTRKSTGTKLRINQEATSGEHARYLLAAEFPPAQGWTTSAQLARGQRE